MDALNFRKHGEWIRYSNGIILCSKCGGNALKDSGECGFTFTVMSKYCPHCGKKMGAEMERTK